jgi:hypothetical protein
MKRYLHDQILKDLKKKRVIITGPRQVGNTCLAKEVMRGFPNPQYLNYDNDNDRRIIPDVDLVIFDKDGTLIELYTDRSRMGGFMPGSSATYWGCASHFSGFRASCI